MKPTLRAAIALALCAAGAAGCSRAPKGPPAPYAGSERCLSCHAKTKPAITKAWQASRHHLTMKLLPDGREIAGAFKLSKAEMKDALAVIGRIDGPRVLIARDLKARRSQGWEEENVCGPPHDALAAAGPLDVDAADACLGCHSTGYSVSRRAVDEAGVGCEACHGPGRKHAETEGAVDAIIKPTKLDAPRINMVCGQCHSQGKDKSGKHPFPVSPDGRLPLAFRPGDDLAEFFVDAQPRRNGHGWEYSLLLRAEPNYAKQLCTDCHDPHGKPGSVAMLKDPTSETCLKCHGLGNQRLRYENHWGLGNAIEKPCWQCHKNTHAH